MIPAGRKLITLDDVAALHGMSVQQARRSGTPPWERPGHPPQANPVRGQRGHKRLWDAEQAAAYARGEPIPDLPPLGHPEDLLDRPEAAEHAGLSTGTWSRYESAERTRTRAAGERPLVPPPDEVHAGVPFWHRRTVETYRAERAEPGRKQVGGRPAGATDKAPRGDELAARIRELAAETDDEGQPLSVAEIARRLDIHYTTAHKHVTAARGGQLRADQHRT